MESKASDPIQPEPSDGQLVQRVLAGEREAFDELIRRYQRQAVAVSYRLLGNLQDALEVTQDAFLKAFTSLDTLQKPEAFGGWLMRIVSNLSLNFRRSRRSGSQLPLDDLLGPSDPARGESGQSEWMARADDPLRQLQSEELGRRLEQALRQLPEKQRLAIILSALLMRRIGYGHVNTESLQSLFEEDSARYAAALRGSQTATQRDPTQFGHWLLFFVNVLVAQKRAFETKLEQQRALLELPGLQERILQAARGESRITTAAVSQALNLPPRTARHHLELLGRNGFLQAHGDKRGRYYTLSSERLPS
jgi:RNA polymerase sigma-70 factor, ECF subfamily